MEITIPSTSIIRFRRWSRKAYAAFASIGRCVTIGCLRKNVADRSLSKQKTAGTSGYAKCSTDDAWKIKKEGISKLRQLFHPIIQIKLTVPSVNTEKRSLILLQNGRKTTKFSFCIYSQQNNHIGTDYRNLYNLFAGYRFSVIRVFVIKKRFKQVQQEKR